MLRAGSFAIIAAQTCALTQSVTRDLFGGFLCLVCAGVSESLTEAHRQFETKNGFVRSFEMVRMYFDTLCRTKMFAILCYRILLIQIQRPFI